MVNRYKLPNMIIVVSMIVVIMFTLCSCDKYTEYVNSTDYKISPAESINLDESLGGTMNDFKNENNITYQTIIDRISNLISGKSDSKVISKDLEIDIELNNIKEGYAELGYLIKDINNDGTEELIIGVNATEKNGKWAGSIYKIFTIANDSVIQVIDGSSRNCYYICEDGALANVSFTDGFSLGYSFFTFDTDVLKTIESVIRKDDYYGESKETTWFYSDSLTYEAYYEIERFNVIDEEKANEVISKYKFIYPKFIPFNE